MCYDLSHTGVPIVRTSIESRKVAALQRTSLFGDLTSEELVEVAQRAVETHLRRGEMLFLSGEAAKGLYVVIRGKIRAFQQDENGREQVMHVDAAGAILGDVPVFDDGPYPASAVSEAESDLLFIEKSDVHVLCFKYPSLALAALELMAAKVRKYAKLVEVLSLHEVGQRVALILITEAKSSTSLVAGPIAFHLGLSNQEIASRIGSVRDVVSRALTRLKHDGLISMEDREVTILDLQDLKRYAGNARNSTTSRSNLIRREI
jgi:CRP-like cAMP-binding protein